MYKITCLKNGTKVATLTVPRANSVAMGAWIGIGGRYEPLPLSGISHFLEHLVFKGTKKRTFKQIKESIEGSGGLLNGFTTEELTCFFVKVLARDAAVGLDVLLDLVSNAQLKKTDMEKERLVIFEELKMYFDLPQHRLHDCLMRMLWPEHPLGRNIAGSFDTLNKMQHSHLLDHKKKYYRWDNMLIVSCGNVAHVKMVEMVKNFTKNAKVQGAFENSGYEPVKYIQKQLQTKFINYNTKQTHIFLGMHGLKRTDRHRHALSLLHIILGANMSSRLFNEIREKKGLAYDIGTSLRRFNDTGAFIVHAGVIDNSCEIVLALILRELKKIRKNLVTRDEFVRARDYYTGQLLMGLEDTVDHMAWMGEQLSISGSIKSPLQVIDEICRVKIGDLTEVARMIFKGEKFNLSVIGRVKNRQKTRMINALKAY
ncbi:MAG: insulinase family protein [Candidatus Omnitrophica bacterium]|nr:insulinase family protein [Candidatus Omnitrophota bacterium]MBU1924776.1 insulinase family protein [Candidatus Omnitrophota bacterium]